MSPFTALTTRLALRRVRKTLVAGHGSCRIRVTVLHDCTLSLAAGEALALGGPLPLARSMLCAIAAGIARPDAGRVGWSPAGLASVRYAPIGDAPRALRPPAGGAANGLVVLDEALGAGDQPPPPTDTHGLVALLAPWLEGGGAALVSARVAPADWPWRRADLVGGALVPAATRPSHAIGAPRARAVAEGGDGAGAWVH